MTDIGVTWQTYGSDQAIQQAPSNISTLFYGQQAVVYGFVENCTQVGCGYKISFHVLRLKTQNNDFGSMS